MVVTGHPDHEEKNCQEGNLSFKKTGSLLLCKISTMEQVQLNGTGATTVLQFWHQNRLQTGIK